MKIQTEEVKENPKILVEKSWDCLWICLEDRSHPTPLKGSALEWIDWKLQGQISRHLLSQKKGRVFIPTLGRISMSYVVLDDLEMNWKLLIEASLGLKWKEVGIIGEGKRRLTPPKEKSVTGALHPETLNLCVEAAFEF